MKFIHNIEEYNVYLHTCGSCGKTNIKCKPWTTGLMLCSSCYEEFCEVYGNGNKKVENTKTNERQLRFLK